MIKNNTSPAALQKRPLGIYLHIPFCVKKCLYCDFLSMPAGDETISRYVEALCGQIRAEAAAYVDYRVNTIFMGGGTPSLLNGEQLKRILQTVFSCFEVEADAEITMESNPGTLTLEKLRAYRKAGVNRLSIGLQSTEDHLLKSLGRIHTWEEFLANFHAAREAGFTNINIDLMSALPGQTAEDWRKTLRKIIELGPEHISAYSLIIEEGTPFYDRYGEEADEQDVHAADTCERDGQKADSSYPALPDEDEERLMYAETESILQQYGYHRYEISNYAREGRECRHNVGNWNRVEYLGFGIGAASLIKTKRFRVIDDLAKYLKLMEKTAEKASGSNSTPVSWDSLHETVQELSISEQMEEFMFLGLRLTEGISADRFAEQFGRKISEVYGEVLEELKRQGLLISSAAAEQNGQQAMCSDINRDERIRLTARGVDVSNYCLAQFLLDDYE